MAERGKHRSTYIADGSNTTIKSGAGSLYTVHVMPGHGSTLMLVDSTNLGTSPDLNSDSLTGIIGRIGSWSTSSNGVSPFPDRIAFDGLGFNTGLTIAATSNARVVVEWE